MTTTLDKELKRQISVDGADYTVALDADGMRLTGKGKRKPEVALRWRDLLSGESALAVALNASLVQRPSATPDGPPSEPPAPPAQMPPEPLPKAAPPARKAPAKRR